MNLIRY